MDRLFERLATQTSAELITPSAAALSVCLVRDIMVLGLRSIGSSCLNNCSSKRQGHAALLFRVYISAQGRKLIDQPTSCSGANIITPLSDTSRSRKRQIIELKANLKANRLNLSHSFPSFCPILFRAMFFLLIWHFGHIFTGLCAGNQHMRHKQWHTNNTYKKNKLYLKQTFKTWTLPIFGILLLLSIRLFASFLLGTYCL